MFYPAGGLPEGGGTQVGEAAWACGSRRGCRLHSVWEEEQEERGWERGQKAVQGLGPSGQLPLSCYYAQAQVGRVSPVLQVGNLQVGNQVSEKLGNS